MSDSRFLSSNESFQCLIGKNKLGLSLSRILFTNFLSIKQLNTPSKNTHHQSRFSPLIFKVPPLTLVFIAPIAVPCLILVRYCFQNCDCMPVLSLLRARGRSQIMLTRQDRQVVIKMSSVCRFSQIPVKEFRHKGVGRWSIMGKIYVVCECPLAGRTYLPT